MKDHPMIKNINRLEPYNFSSVVEGNLQEGKRVDIEVVGKWRVDGRNMMGIRYDKKGLIVTIGSFAGEKQLSGDLYQLLRNAVRYRKYGRRKSK